MPDGYQTHPPADWPVATRAIDIDGVRAFNVGDPVPPDHVKDFDLKDSVARAGTKAAAEAVEVPTSPPAKVDVAEA